VAGQWYMKPQEQLISLEGASETKFSLYFEQTDRLADEVAVYIMLEENANLQDFIDMGRYKLSPPDYVLDGKRVAR
jgi:hypothetical protein